MDGKKGITEFKNAVKLIALFQAALEQMDTLKGSKLYRHKLKSQMIALEKTIETTVFGPLKQLDNTDEDLFSHIQKNVEMILDMDLDELSQLKVVIDEAREDEPNR